MNTTNDLAFWYTAFHVGPGKFIFCEVSALSTYIKDVDIILHAGPLEFIIQFVAQSFMASHGRLLSTYTGPVTYVRWEC